MDIDIALLAQQVAGFLIPYLVKGGEAFASESGKKIAESLWGKFKPKVEAKESAEDALQVVKDAPDDKNAQTSFEDQIKKILAENPKFAAEISITAGEITYSSIQAGDGNVIVGRDVENSNILNKSNGNVVAGGDIKANKLALGQGAQAADTIINNNFSGEKTSSNLDSAERLMHEYLDALIADCEKLPLGAIHLAFEEAEHKGSIDLEDVYIDMDVKPSLRGREARGQKELEAAEREPQRIPIVKALEDENLRRAVLLGEAGSGKTTCVHYMTIALALIQQNAIAKKPLPEDSTLARYFPVRLILRDVAQYISSDPKIGGVDILWDALRGDLTKKIGKEQADQLFPHLENHIKTTPCLIMLDGLDEVPESKERRPRLLEAIENFAAPLKQSIVMVTARPYAYEKPEWKLANFETLELLDFSPEQIENFISNFYSVIKNLRNWDDAFTDLRKNDLNKDVQDRAYLGDLAKRPLFLTLIASVDSSGAQLPDGRAELYKQTIDLLLQRWQRRKENSVAEKEQEIVKFFSTDADKVLGILQELAYKVHERQGREAKPEKADTPADIDKYEVWGVFSSSLKDTPIDLESLLKFLNERTGLLLNRNDEEGVYMFPHRSFQEYLAACYISNQPDPAGKLNAMVLRDIRWWREVVLLGVAKIKSGSLGNAVHAVNTFVPRAPEEMKREIKLMDWQAAALAGQALIEIRLKENSADQPLYETIIERITKWLVQLIETSVLTPRERAEAGNTLAKLGDPRIGVTNGLLLCEIPAGKFMMGSKEGEKDSDEREYPRFEYNIPNNYFMSRYPVTNAQFDLFVKDPNGYTNDGWWTEAGLKWRGDRKQQEQYSGAFSLLNHPVVGVTWYEAYAFTRWATQKLNMGDLGLHVWKNEKIEPLHLENKKYEVRLPSEAEWERAARGGQESRCPWGDEITPNHANYSDTNLNVTSAVGAFPLGMNDYGLLDMSGNVWEWTRSEYKEYPFDPKEKLEKIEDTYVLRVLRGGAFDDYGRDVRCAYRYWRYPDGRGDSFGFRVVVVASPISL